MKKLFILRITSENEKRLRFLQILKIYIKVGLPVATLSLPQLVSSLSGVPVKQISAGTTHSIVWCASPQDARGFRNDPNGSKSAINRLSLLSFYYFQRHLERPQPIKTFFTRHSQSDIFIYQTTIETVRAQGAHSEALYSKVTSRICISSKSSHSKKPLKVRVKKNSSIKATLFYR